TVTHLTLAPAVSELLDEARTLGLELDLTAARSTVREAVRRALVAVREEPSIESIAMATSLIGGLRSLNVNFGLWATQNEFFEIWREHPAEHPMLASLGPTLGFALPLAGERDNGAAPRLSDNRGTTAR